MIPGPGEERGDGGVGMFSVSCHFAPKTRRTQATQSAASNEG